MGIQPKPDEYGNDCLECFAPGKTPRLMKLFVSGIQRGDRWTEQEGPPPSGYFDCHQRAANPCWFSSHIGHPWIIDFTLATGLHMLDILNGYSHYCFKGYQYNDCRRTWTNYMQTPANRYFYGGSAAVSTAQIMASEVSLVTPLIDPNPRMELFPLIDDRYVVRYAGKRDATNIMIEVDLT